MSIRHSVVDCLTIICAVGYHRRDPRCDLIKKTHYFRYVADIVLRQFNDDDFMRIGIDAEMQFAPASRGTNTTLLHPAIRPRHRSSDRCCPYQMEWFVTIDRLLAELSTRPLDDSMSYGREWQYRCRAEPQSIAAVLQSDAAAGGTPAKRKRGLDGYCRIDRLTATPSGGWCTPLSNRLVGEPHRQCTPSHQSCVIVRPVRDTIFRGGDFVATRFVELVRHGFLHRGIGQSATLPFGHQDRQFGLRSRDVRFAVRNDGQCPGIHAPTRWRTA